jgi:hypothetical protein
MEKNLKPYKCGLIMPIAAIDNCPTAHWDAVRLIIKEALEDSEYEVSLVSDSNEIGIIQKRIVQNIFSNEMVICDVSAKNPNVMFELGMRLAFDKPILIIKDDFTNYSFDTGVIEHLNYPRDLNYHSIQAFKLALKTKLVATHKATSEPGYSSFLTSFSTVTASKLPEKEVGSMDYLLETMSEMREEIRSLAKVQSNAQSSFKGTRHGAMDLSNYIARSGKSIEDFDSATDPEFRKLYNEFIATQRDIPKVSAGEEAILRAVAYNMVSSPSRPSGG